MKNALIIFLQKLKNSFIWKLLLQFQKLILFTTSCVMVGVLGAVVLCRYVIHTDLFGYDEIVMISAFWMYFIGSSYAMEKREHVRADILERILPPIGIKWLHIISSILQTLIALETARLSIDYMINGFKIWPTTSAWGLPLITSMSAVTIGMVIMAFYVVVQLLEELTGTAPAVGITSEERGQ